ncbi:hypothetical protein ACHAWU_004971 [Discostella pseudostelligera]|uniref:Uncharacterized protein n=1 Tax=Discostella pseudostelligera TaxID=259834 RepID=A0ABD3N9P8_9STRA
MREILSLRFNPGGTMAELSSADSGITILICRARSSEDKAALKKREVSEDRTRATRTLADEERAASEALTTHSSVCPEDYNELLRCLGTYCALLHTLFGPRCAFYKHCFILWETMESEYVYERRRFFSPVLCRQIVWAIIEEGRAYFSQRMSPDDFIGVNHYDIVYPKSGLIKLDDFIRQQSPIVRSSFPATWVAGGAAARLTGGSQAMTLPVASITTGPTTPTVVSGLSTGTGARTAATGAPQRTPPKVRATNIHPLIKTLMEPYIPKCRGVLLGPMMEHLGITIDDLPKLPGEQRVCYNYVLGRCTPQYCKNKDGHINASDITDKFATALIEKIRPAVTHFITNGPPPLPAYNRRRRRE